MHTKHNWLVIAHFLAVVAVMLVEVEVQKSVLKLIKLEVSH